MVTAQRQSERLSTKAKWGKRLNRVKNERELWVISLLMIIWVAIFAYYPMFGVVIAFEKYFPGQPFLNGNWVGFYYFISFFKSADFWKVMRNTLAISGLNLLFAFPAPIILALLINEMVNKKYKRFIQTVSYIPHFISWVVAADLIYTLLGNGGLLNDVLVNLHFINEPINFLNEGKYFWGIITVADIWKEVGWGSIIYLSAISGIDTELYEAGAVDGLGRAGMVWHITLPCLLSTIVLMWILSVGDLLNAGFEQQLLLGNNLTRDYYEVIDTYSYRYGIQLGNFSYGTAVSLMKGIISVTLVFFTNWFTKKKLDLAVL